MRTLLVRALLGFVLMMGGVAAYGHAQTADATPATRGAMTASPHVQEQMAQLQQQVSDAKSAGDNAWMLVSSALVLMMTGPGLALFYGGLVRKKNVLATMMQSFTLMALITVLWALFGYSLAFGPGDQHHRRFRITSFLRGVGAAPDADYAATIPAQTFMVFQLMFAIITPGLITGAFAERMKFSAMVLFMVLWSILVYSPMAHMVWGKGGLLNAALGGALPTLDFAGGTVVHITSGVSALVCALYLGRRLGYPKEPMPPHSVVLSVIGACLLWVGWFGFNAGSALAAGSLATSAFVATHFARGSGGAGLDGRGVAAQRQAQRSGRDLRSGRRPGGHHAGLRLRESDAGADDRAGRGDRLLPHGGQGQRQVRLRRFARRFRRARSGGTIGALADRRLRLQRHQSASSRTLRGTPWPAGLLEGNARQLLNQLVGRGNRLGTGHRGNPGHPEGGRCAHRAASPRRARGARSGPLAARGGRL